MLFHETLTESVLRPTYLTIDLSAVTSNFKKIIKKAGQSKVMFILKANAYGHGLIRIARHLELLGADYFGVAYLEEGIMLRDAGIRVPILVLGGIIGNQLPKFIEYDLTITASSIEKLNHIEETAKKLHKKARAHLKIDTGMERIGMHFYSAEKLIEATLQCRHTFIEGVFTHLAKSDEVNQEYTNLQLDRFDEVLSYYERLNVPRPMVHALNSGGLLHSHERSYDMSRIGILLYGIYPSPHLKAQISLKPVMTWKTQVVYFKVVKANFPVSYGGTWSSKKPTRVITIPVGYGDGYMRYMSNKAYVLVRSNRYPQVGNICMDQFMVDIGEGTAYNGDEVILVGRQGDEEIRIEDLAEWAGTIPYEVMTNINTRVPRVYIE